MPHTTTFEEIKAEFTERVHAAMWCSAATVDRQQRPRSRVLHPIWEGATGWIATTRHSPKSTHLAAHPYLSLAYVHDPFKPVYVECGAAWVDDPTTKQRVWELFKQAPPPLGYGSGLDLEQRRRSRIRRAALNSMAHRAV